MKKLLQGQNSQDIVQNFKTLHAGRRRKDVFTCYKTLRIKKTRCLMICVKKINYFGQENAGAVSFLPFDDLL